MQLPCGLDSKVSQEGPIRTIAQVSWPIIQGFGPRNRECEVLEGHMMPDHVHMLVSISPKYAVAQVIGYIKGKSAIHVARNYLGNKRNFTGAHFWVRGYHVSTVGRDEQMIRDYIKAQEEEVCRIDQLNLFK
jgi:REP-associated tyrosine transposase